jgi:hypothetical protein
VASEPQPSLAEALATARSVPHSLVARTRMGSVAPMAMVGGSSTGRHSRKRMSVSSPKLWPAPTKAYTRCSSGRAHSEPKAHTATPTSSSA